MIKKKTHTRGYVLCPMYTLICILVFSNEATPGIILSCHHELCTFRGTLVNVFCKIKNNNIR